MPDRQAELRHRLRTLKLPAMARLFGELALRAAKAELTHEAYLFELVQAECAEREERRLVRLQRASSLPLEKSFHSLKLERFSPTIRQQIEQLRSGGFVQEAVNVIAVGPPGAGKSHLLAALGQELISQGQPVLWTATATLVQRLLAAKRDLRLPQELARLDRYACLILDDIGYVQHNRDEMEVFFTLLAERYERRSVALSTNLVFSEWERIFKDPLTTLAAIDRLVHHAVILDLMQVPSYRAHTATSQRERPAPAAPGPAPSQEGDQETDQEAPSP
jgi:DNA replication protein DnaC